MPGERILEFLSTGLYISQSQGFLVVKDRSKELDRVPLDDIFSLIVSGTGQTISTNLLSNLNELKIPVVFCSNKYLPSGLLLPTQGNHLYHQRLKSQIALSTPVKKKLWQKIVKSKLLNQSFLLDRFDIEGNDIAKMAERVRSGDPDNLEAQGARKYWVLLFGNDFRRNRCLEGENTLLNFGYTILRSAVARSLVASGLNPGIGIHHDNQNNHFCLVDDMIEPFRPFIDEGVKLLSTRNLLNLSQVSRRVLTESIHSDVLFEGQITSVRNTIERCCKILVHCFEDSKMNLEFPNFDPNGVLKNVNFGL